MLPVAVIGIGAMGCLFAAKLAPFARVTMLGHWPQQLDALQSGLTLITPGGAIHRVRVSAGSDPQSIGPAAVALVLVKSYQTLDAARAIETLLQRGGVAITLQNGIGNEGTLASVLGPERVLLGVTTEGATLIGLGVVRHAGYGETVLPQLGDRRAALVKSFAAAMCSAGYKVTFSADTTTLIWQKLAVNAAINPLTALVDAPNGFLLSSKAANSIARRAAEETALVAQALGHTVAPEDAAERALAVAEATSENISSMLQDLRNGRQTELEAITGAIIRHGEQRNVPIPVNRALYQLLTAKLAGKDWMLQISTLPKAIIAPFLALAQENSDENS